MHVNLPKPLHGWRAFVGEVGIIVLGVLIALGAEQAVQSLHARTTIKEDTDALRREVADHSSRWSGASSSHALPPRSIILKADY